MYQLLRCVKSPTMMVHLNIFLTSTVELFFICFKLLYLVHTSLELLYLPREFILSSSHMFPFSLIIFFFFALRSVLSDITIATLALFWIVFAHNVLFYFKKMCSFSHFFTSSLSPSLCLGSVS